MSRTSFTGKHNYVKLFRQMANSPLSAGSQIPNIILTGILTIFFYIVFCHVYSCVVVNLLSKKVCMCDSDGRLYLQVLMVR